MGYRKMRKEFRKRGQPKISDERMVCEFAARYEDKVIELAKAGKTARPADLVQALKLSYRTFLNHQRRYATAYHGEKLKDRLHELWLANLPSPDGVCILSFPATGSLAPQIGTRLDAVPRPVKHHSDQTEATREILASLGK